MGRGRDNGPVDQSTKKPKVRKNKERGDNWALFKTNSIGENTELPILVSEELLAEMKKMTPQELMNILLPDNKNNVSSTSEKKNNCQLTDAIQILPTGYPIYDEDDYEECFIKSWNDSLCESLANKCIMANTLIKKPPIELPEKMRKEYNKIKLKERKDLGWGEVHKELEKIPFCKRRERLVKVMFCLEHLNCGVDGICLPCMRKSNINHYVFPDIDEYNCPRRCIEICDDELEHEWIQCKLKGLDPMPEIKRKFYW